MDKTATTKLVKYPACCKCQKIIKTRQKLRCYYCKNYYDIECSGVSTTRFLMMEKSRREGWKCQACYEKDKVPESSQYTHTPSSSNVTRRKNMPKAVQLTPAHKSEEEESTSSDDDLHSMPDIFTTTFQNDREMELMKEITQLKLELASAHNEVEKLMLENRELKKQDTVKDKLVEKWKKLFTEAISTPKKRNSLAKKETPEKKSAQKTKNRAIELNDSSCSTLDISKTGKKSPIKPPKNEKLEIQSGMKKSNKTEQNKHQKTNKNNVVIFSDSIGQGIATKIIEKTDYQALNTCKPEAGFQEILENYENKIKDLDQNDTVAILITKYENSIYYHKRKYLKLLNNILNESERKFNMIITGLRYNGKHDEDIYNINMQIANTARVNANVKYIDPNIRHENTKNYMTLKNFVIENVITSINNKCKGTSSLRFINCHDKHSATTDKRTNFPMTQRPSQER